MNPGHAPGPAGFLTLLCFALPVEAVAFQKRLAARRGSSSERDAALEILFTGVGQHQAERALARALATRVPARVLSCGFAGALNPALAVGEVGFETGDAAFGAALRAAGAKPIRFLTVDRVAVSAAEKAALRQASGADAADMESAALEALCRARGIAFAVVRAISDAADEDLPLDFNRLVRADGSLRYGALLGALARRPASVAGLLRLQRQCRLASERLAEVLASVLWPGA
jgi:adenosylhomocysteine nucleosidase